MAGQAQAERRHAFLARPEIEARVVAGGAAKYHEKNAEQKKLFARERAESLDTLRTGNSGGPVNRAKQVTLTFSDDRQGMMTFADTRV